MYKDAVCTSQRTLRDSVRITNLSTLSDGEGGVYFKNQMTNVSTLRGQDLKILMLRLAVFTKQYVLKSYGLFL